MQVTWYSLKDLVEIKYGKNQKKVQDDKNGKYPILGTGGLMGYSKEYLYDKPSVLIGRKGSIQKVKYSKEPFWTVDTLFYTKVNQNIVIPKFLYYSMSLLDLNRYNEGTTIPSLRTETLYRLEFPIPNLTYQKKVLKILNFMDDKIILLDKINRNLKNQIKALYNETFFNYSKYDNLMYTELGYIPNSWGVGSIGDYAKVKSGFAFKSSWWQDEGIKVIKIKELNQDGINLKDCSCVSKDKITKAKNFLVEEGDIVIAMTGATLGKFSLIPKINELLLVNQRVGKFFLGDNPLEKAPFLWSTLHNKRIFDEIINRGQGSAQPNISPKDIETIPIILPPLAIIDKFNEQCLPMFKLMTHNNYEIAKLEQLRDTLLPKLMNGEIDVSKIKFKD